MFSDLQLILVVTPAEGKRALSHALPLAHTAYRVGGGPHLFRATVPVAIRGGLMVIDDAGFPGGGEAVPFCHEVLRECTARGFTGVVCLFSGRPSATLAKALPTLGELMAKRNWPLYVTEAYGAASDYARVLIPSALSGGSLRQRLGEAAARYGVQRLALSVERSAMDFFLPSPTGQGTPLTREQLAVLMEEQAPAVYFSDELCAHYFTYRSGGDGAHFILFDDAGSIRKKLHIAQQLGIRSALLPYGQTEDLLGELLS